MLLAGVHAGHLPDDPGRERVPLGGARGPRGQQVPLALHLVAAGLKLHELLPKQTEVLGIWREKDIFDT